MSLYFSRLTLNRDAPMRALSALLDPENADACADAHHRLIWTLFAKNRSFQTKGRRTLRSPQPQVDQVGPQTLLSLLFRSQLPCSQPGLPL